MPSNDRINISLDEESRADLTVCMTAYASENEGSPVTFSKVVHEALRRWAIASGIRLPKPARKGKA
jgi:hypothetical protein